MKRQIPILALVCLCALAYANSLRNDFTYDDAGMMEQEMFSNIRDLKSFLTPDYYRFSGELTFRPLVTLSYFGDFVFWRFNPFGFHLTNLFWHAATTVLVYLVLLQLFGAAGPALAGAMVFAVHPVQTEAVNSVGFREDLICASAYFLSFLLYLRTGGGAGRERGRALRYALSLAAFFCALAAKEMAITLPVAIVLHDLLLAPPGGSDAAPRRLGRTARLVAGYACVAAAYLFLRYRLLYNPSEAAAWYAGGSLLSRAAAVPRLIALYLRILILPVGLSVEYDRSALGPLLSPGGVAALAACIGLAWAITYLRRRDPRACFFAAFIPLSLLPVLNLVPLCNPVAERYLYLPCFGFAGLAAAGFAAMQRRGRGRTAAVLALAVCAVYASSTVLRNRVWRDTLSLWSDGARNAPGSARAHLNLGVALAGRGCTERALAEYRESARLRPTAPDAYNNMGLILMGEGRIDEAAAQFRKAVEVDPHEVRSYLNLALALAKKGEKAEAARILELLVASREMNAPLKCALANLYLDLGLPGRAAEQFRQALEIKPYSFDALTGLGKISFRAGRIAEAEGYFDRACGVRGASYARAVSMGNIQFARGRLDAAEAEYRKAVALKPGLAEGYNNLGLVCRTRGENGKAAAYFEKALKLEPGNPTILCNLAETHYLAGRTAEARACAEKIFGGGEVPEQAARDLATFYFKTGRCAEAEEVFRAAVERHPRFGWGYVHRARALLVLGRPGEAAACLEAGAPHFSAEQRRALRADPVFAPVAAHAGTAGPERAAP